MSTKEMMTEAQDLKARSASYKAYAVECFDSFKAGGNDNTRIMGNKWATAAKLMQQAAERVEKLATAA